MSNKTNKGHLFFRSYLTDVPRGSKNAPKSFAFSPDIVPQYGNQLSPTILEDEYKAFIALPLQPNDNNNIYVRAVSTADTSASFNTAVTLRAVPSELILWPQVWNQVAMLNPGPVVIPADSPNELVAGSAPFTLRPSNLGGIGYSLIASQSIVPAGKESDSRMRDNLRPLPLDINNWRDYYKFITSDTSTTYYNVIVADPTSPIISISTRLRIFEDDPAITSVDLQIMVESAAISPDTEVSLSSPDGSINLLRKMIGTGDFGVHASLPNGYDDIITMNIFPPSDTTLTSSSWISLQVAATQTDNDGISTLSLLGAQNIVFNAVSTRNLRFASPNAVQAKALQLGTSGADVAAGVDIPSAVGWWFRDALGNTNSFPRVGVFSHSPDIQGTGSHPDSNIVADIGGSTTQNVDYMDNHQVVLANGQPNFFYLRGNCTLGNYQVDSRLYAVPCGVLLSPSTYAAQWSVNDYDGHGNPTWAKRSLTTTADNSFNVFTTPFDLLNPNPPSVYGSDHYCMIAETRHPTDFNPDPLWPHEQIGDFATGADFNVWISSTPNVAWRNVTYTYIAGAPTKVMPTTMTIPAHLYPSTATWTLTANAYNATSDSFWQLTGAGPAVPGVSIGFTKVQLGSANASQGCHFTGVPNGGYHASLILQWWPGPSGVPNGLRFSFTLFSTTSPADPAFAISRPLPLGAEDWAFSVGKYHPGLPTFRNSKGRQALESTFEKIGTQPWPYAKALKEHRTKKAPKHRPRHGKYSTEAGPHPAHVEQVEPVQAFVIGGDTFHVYP